MSSHVDSKSLGFFFELFDSVYKKARGFAETSRTAFPITHPKIPENLYLQEHRRDKKIFLFISMFYP
jgi:hypothetical protein